MCALRGKEGVLIELGFISVTFSTRGGRVENGNENEETGME